MKTWSNKYQQKLYERRRMQGLCIDCEKPLDRDGVRCIKCNDRRNAEIREMRKESQSIGMCPKCGKRKLWGDEKQCLECRTKNSENAMQNRKKNGAEHYNEVHREWSRKAYEARKQQGTCTRCGKRPAQSGYCTCGICRSRDAAKRQERERINGRMSPEERREYRALVGLCYFCDNPVKPGYKICEKHYNMNLKKQKKANQEEARRTLEMHFTRKENGEEDNTGEDRKNPPA